MWFKRLKRKNTLSDTPPASDLNEEIKGKPIERWHEIAWEKLPKDIRLRAVGRLRSTYNRSFFEEVADLVREHGLGNWQPGMWHMFQGMTVRNVLRSDSAAYDVNPDAYLWDREIMDSELPSFDEYYGVGTDVRNWDDYYVQCVEAAAGMREI